MKLLNTTLTLLFISIFFSTTFAQNCDANYSYVDTVNNQIAFSPDTYDSNLNYFWDFGDGNTSTNAYPFHEYANPGTYTACLTVWDNNTPACSDTICQAILVDSLNCSTSADFTYTSLGNGTYEFEALNPGSGIYLQWDIENTNYYGSPVTHTFASNGQYSATLYAYDSLQNCSDTYTTVISVTDADTCNYNASFSFNEVSNNYFTFSPDNYDSTASYDWNFGDGNHSSDPYPSHDYTSNGSYTVCLTMWNNSSNGWCADTVCQTIIDSTSNCNADLSFNTTGNPGEIEIVDNSTTASGANATYSWVEFYHSSPWQHETTIYLQPNNTTQTYQFSQNGDYTYFFTVQDSITNCMDTLMGTITINNVSSSCDATFSYLDTVNGETYFMPNNYDQNLSYYWDFGDGNYSYDPFPTHTYTAAGTYTACLTVWENGGNCGDTVCQSVVVTNNNINCNADFYLFQDSLNTNVYYIWNLSSGNNLSYNWDFGDGTTSNQQYPTHTYTNQGMYTICLTITDNQNNCSDQYCQTIEVLNKATGTTINVVPFGQTTGVETQQELTVDATVYPNPATSELNIVLDGSTSEFEYEIMDVMGNIIERGQLEGQGNKQSKSVQVNNLETGIYFVQLIDATNKERVDTIKFIKR